MQTGTFESTYPVLGAIKWDKTYEAVLATPARVADLLVGQLLYVAFRVTTATYSFKNSGSGRGTTGARCRPLP